MSGEHANERADHFGQRAIPSLIRHYTSSDIAKTGRAGIVDGPGF